MISFVQTPTTRPPTHHSLIILLTLSPYHPPPTTNHRAARKPPFFGNTHHHEDGSGSYGDAASALGGGRDTFLLLLPLLDLLWYPRPLPDHLSGHSPLPQQRRLLYRHQESPKIASRRCHPRRGGCYSWCACASLRAWGWEQGLGHLDGYL